MVFIFHLIGLTKPCAAEDCDREFKPCRITAERQTPGDMESQQYCCHTCANIATLNRPEVRKTISDKLKASHADPKVKARRSAAAKAAHARPETKAKHRAAVKDGMNRPEIREKISSKVKAAWARPEVKTRMSNARKAWHARPESKAKHRIAVKTSLTRPEVKLKKSAYMKALWQIPEERAKRSAALKAWGARPEVKAKRSAAAKAWYARPGMKAKHRATLLAAHARPEVKANRRVAMKALWQSPDYREKLFRAWVARSEARPGYPSYFSHQIVPLIRDRAEHHCEYCDCKHKLMDVHHIDHRTFHNRPENLIYLCRRCHINFGHNDAGRPDFERIAPERTRAMPIGWHEALNDVMSHAERCNREVYGSDLYGLAL